MTPERPTYVLVLAHRGDAGAEAVARAIAARRGAAILSGGPSHLPRALLVRPEELGRARRWSHTLTTDGSAGGALELHSGILLGAEDVCCVLNRVVALPLARFARASARDRDYAAMEMHALLASWLLGLGCQVVNPMDGEGPAGRWSRLRWLASAAQVGLPVLRRAATGAAAPGGRASSLLVTGERAHGELSPLFEDAAAELAARSRCPLLELTFARSRGEWALAEVEPTPALHREAEVEAVADLLLAHARRGALVA